MLGVFCPDSVISSTAATGGADAKSGSGAAAAAERKSDVGSDTGSGSGSDSELAAAQRALVREVTAAGFPFAGVADCGPAGVRAAAAALVGDLLLRHSDAASLGYSWDAKTRQTIAFPR